MVTVSVANNFFGFFSGNLVITLVSFVHELSRDAWTFLMRTNSNYNEMVIVSHEMYSFYYVWTHGSQELMSLCGLRMMGTWEISDMQQWRETPVHALDHFPLPMTVDLFEKWMSTTIIRLISKHIGRHSYILGSRGPHMHNKRNHSILKLISVIAGRQTTEMRKNKVLQMTLFCVQSNSCEIIFPPCVCVCVNQIFECQPTTLIWIGGGEWREDTKKERYISEAIINDNVSFVLMLNIKLRFLNTTSHCFLVSSVSFKLQTYK